ncbi:MAG TPA: DUF5060 domain-containing protein, partial [Thermoanaerobaculia bacterium]|nr:DUF5060 domain-containing protein [Thermoanaerobaculia bacterium]
MRRGAVLFVIFAASMGSVSMAQMPQHLQWNRIEIPLTSQRDYSSGNPYRDLTIEATFTQRVTLKKVVGYGFWNGGTDFRVRTALPPGIWDWSTKCYGVTASKYCNQAGNFANDSGLWKTGSFQVCAYKDATCLNKPSTGVPAIYLRGFLKTPRSTSNQPARYLVYDDGTKFFWSADTAWEAPVDANPTNWNTYLADRKNKKFTTVLVGSAPQYSGTIVSFDQIQNCSSSYPVPNPCSRWNTAYWQKFDTLVQAANQAGLVVVVVGLVDPVDRGKYDTGTYPLSSEAVTFARNLAARLSGNFVIFSPGFDDRKDARLGDQVSTVQQSMNAVLSELQRVVPRHLLTNHLAGSSSVADYDLFKTWVKFNLYQSGHALNLAAACPGLSLTRQQCAVKRARELSLNFVDGIHPKPAVNGEGGYEYPTNPNAVPPDNRYGVRHTGYYSVLSGSFGFTLGVDKIVHWEDPMTNLNSLSARDMTILAARFRGRRWYEMKPMHERIKNNQGLPEEQRMVLAGTGDNALAIGYLPNNISIQIDTSLFSGLSCTSTIWTRQWIDPRVGNAIDIPKTACADGTGRITLSRPPCNPNSNPAVSGACDWIVELRNTKVNTSDNSTAMLLPDQVLAMTIVKTWAQVDDSGDTSTILADLVDS